MNLLAEGLPAAYVSSVDDPSVALFRNVRDRDLAGRHGVFMAEGELVVRALLTRSRFRAHSLLLSEKRWPGFRQLLEGLDPCPPVFVAPQSVMNEVVGFPIHRGVLAVAERPQPTSLPALIDAAAGPDLLLLCLDGLTNHDNVGASFRNAAAFGVDGVVLDERCCDPLYRKSVRVSIGAALTVPFVQGGRMSDLLAVLKSQGFMVGALTPASSGSELRALKREGRLPARIALVLGTEGPGSSPALIGQADVALRIDMVEGFDSLNVATAGAIALHGVRQLRKAEEGG